MTSNSPPEKSESAERTDFKKITLYYNIYRGGGKQAWIARILDNSTREFLDPVLILGDRESGSRTFYVPLLEGAIYEFCNVRTKTRDDRYFMTVRNGILVKREPIVLRTSKRSPDDQVVVKDH
ncbi:MAG: hypothetical protein ACFFD4_33090 [Candidatus Odinarchaeota archaeon]